MEIKSEKSDFAIEEIILSDSNDENREDDIELLTDVRENQSIKSSNAENTFLLENSFRRGLLPEENEISRASVLYHPVVKRCCLEHCYFARNRLSENGSLKNSPTHGCTLQFQNESEMEQQTIDNKCLASDAPVSLSDSVIQNNIVENKEQIGSVCSTSSSDTEESLVNDTADKDYCPEENSTGTDSEDASAGSCESCVSSKPNRKRPRSNLIKDRVKNFKNVSDDRKKTISRHRLGITNYPSINKIPNNFVSVHDLLTKIRNMQKLMKSNCDKDLSNSEKTEKIPPPKLKKMMNRGKMKGFPNISKYSFPMPNLTKMVTDEKNWKVEYMNDDAQNIGLDDLLLKASELNAENFTKALGRKDLVKSNFNKKDNSEIVLTIPKPKKNLIEEQSYKRTENEFSKNSKLKTIKLDISKPFYESEKVKEAESNPEGKSSDTSPKKPGIKVKTVENINEEFKDSLEHKNKIFQDCVNGVTKDVASVLDSQNLSINSFSDPVVNSMANEEAGLQEKIDNSDSEQARPFVMTIIQSKAEKQRPAILRNSSYLKKKNNSESVKSIEKLLEAKTDESSPMELTPNMVESEKYGLVLSDSQSSKFNDLHTENFGGVCWTDQNSLEGKDVGIGSQAMEKLEKSENKISDDSENKLAIKKRNIPFILNHNRRARQSDSGNGASQLISVQSKMVKVNEEKASQSEKPFKVTSVEQKLGPKEANRRFIKVVPYEPGKKSGVKVEASKGRETQPKNSDEEVDKTPPSGHLLSLSAFSAILKEILPDKWFLILDKKYGLQIIKTHLDDQLNPSILISMVIARCGKVTVNVRGKQLEKSHELFSNLRDIGNFENKLSLNYVLAIIHKLRYLSVCCGCDDPSLKKYWCEDGVVEHQTESQQVYRSHSCQLLVSLGKKRCYPCYRMNESLKKRYRRDKLEEKCNEDSGKVPVAKDVPEEPEPKTKNNFQTKGVKRNLEYFLEESFQTMKQQIVNEIEKNKKLGEQENSLKTQEEVLSFMGLTRKDSLDNPVRKSKRKKNTFFKLQQPVRKKVNQKELEFLEKYWSDINTLFSTSLLFGAYSRTGRGRLREKCRMFRKLLSTWRDIVRSNSEWIGGEITVPDELIDGCDPLGKDSGADYFEKMEAPGLRAYIINSVKEVNRIKHKLKTRNSYFKILYNRFVKRRMKRPKLLNSNCEKKGTASSANSTTNTPTPTDFSSDDSSRDREKVGENENSPADNVISEEGD